MRKNVICIFIMICMLATGSVSAANFVDVPANSDYYDAVSYLSDNGIITGYGDGTFMPKNTITRAEAAAIIARAAGLTDAPVFGQKFIDVSPEHWAFNNVAQVANAGIINGYGDGNFGPGDNVTYYQIIKMIVCMAGKESIALQHGGWPFGYVDAALYSGIIDTNTNYELEYNNQGNSPAVRGDVAKFVYNAIKNGNVQQGLNVGGAQYSIGMNATAMGVPDEILKSTEGFDWYVYGTDTYEKFFAAGVADGKVIALAASGKGFEYKGMKAGEHSAGRQEYIDNSESVYLDKNDDNKIHSVFIRGSYRGNAEINEEVLAGESKMIFHFTNAFRVLHGKAPLIWSEEAHRSSTLHSQDMAINNYFSHDSLSGTKHSERMSNQGIRWTSCGENIVAGHSLGFEAYNAWVNSAGHRGNMLSDYTYLGVGGGYSAESMYRYYFTQNFYSMGY